MQFVDMKRLNLPSQELTNSLNSILTDLSEDEIENFILILWA